MWNISKEFSFCYGHRVWSQSLNPEFSLDDNLICRHLHGHQGKLKVYLQSDNLKSGMVSDFKHLNWLKKFIDDELDHRFILDVNDPLYPSLLRDFYKNGKAINLISHKQEYQTVDISSLDNPNDATIEMYDSYVLVDFVPTSENISEWIYKIASEKMKKLDVKVSKVEFFETPKTCSAFTP